MENNLVLFEQQNMVVFKQLADLTKQKKELEAKEKEVKEKIKKAMDEHGVKSFKNDFVTISNVAGSSSTTIDIAKMQEKEPDLYKDLMRDYPKTTTRSGYVKIVAK